MAGTTPPGRLAGLTYGFASGGDDHGLRDLLRRTPMPGPVRVAFEREPDYFAAARAEGGIHHTVCARDSATGRIVAMASRCVRELYVNGRPRRVGYLGQLRIDPGCRMLTRPLLRRGFALLQQTHAHDEEPFDITTIVAGNHPARRLLLAGLPGTPRYTRIGDITTLLIPADRARPPGSPILRELWSNPPSEPRQFQPVTPTPPLWDQRSFRQLVVRGYAPWLRWLRWPLRLPPTGSVLPVAYLTGRPDQIPEDCRWLLLGLSDRHPLLPRLRHLCRWRTYRSTLYVVHPPGATVELDDRIPHAEVALL